MSITNFSDFIYIYNYIYLFLSHLISAAKIKCVLLL